MWNSVESVKEFNRGGVWATAKGVVFLSNDGMNDLKEFFKDSEPNEMNFVLFSTSGSHGTYTTIEEAAKVYLEDLPEEDFGLPEVTFVLIQPRIVCLRYGNALIKSKEDIEFLKQLRDKSKKVIQYIG